jgi:hypothetical protein
VGNIFGCPSAQWFWAAIGCPFVVETNVVDMHAYTLPPSIPAPDKLYLLSPVLLDLDCSQTSLTSSESAGIMLICGGSACHHTTLYFPQYFSR